MAKRRAPRASAVTSHPPDDPTTRWPRIALSGAHDVTYQFSYGQKIFALSGAGLGSTRHGGSGLIRCREFAWQAAAKARRSTKRRQPWMSASTSIGRRSRKVGRPMVLAIVLVRFAARRRCGLSMQPALALHIAHAVVNVLNTSTMHIAKWAEQDSSSMCIPYLLPWPNVLGS